MCAAFKLIASLIGAFLVAFGGGGPVTSAGFASAEEPSQPVDPMAYLRKGMAGPGFYFRSPSGALICAILADGRYAWGQPGTGVAACHGPAAIPVDGEDCGPNPDYSQPVDAVGVLGPRQFCVTEPLFWAENAAALPYGSSLGIFGYTCASRTTGVTCVHDADGHGFHISRENNELF